MLRHDLDRRLVLSAAASLALGTSSSFADPEITPETIDLWPAAPPGPTLDLIEKRSPAGSLTGISRPRLNVYRPARPNGTAMIVMAGGGYAHLESGHESQPACRWLAGIGVLAAELIYRLPADGWPAEAPQQDAQRAVRLLRSRLTAGARLGLLGFSAGGHLAGMIAMRPEARLYTAVDVADARSARPDFAALLYPVVSMLPPLDQTRSRRELLGRDPDPSAAAALSVDRLVSAQAPPVFLAQAIDDPISPVENSFLLATALRRAGKPVELHVFQTGGHGWGMGQAGTSVALWPTLLAHWLGGLGALPGPPAPL